MTESETKTEVSPVEDKPKEETAAAGAETTATANEEPPVKEMRAVVLTGFGGLKSVKIQQKPQPTPAEDEVLIRVRATGLNFPDLMARQGALDNLPKAPFIMGFELAGEVEAVGEKVEGFTVGQRVCALSDMKAWAELTAVPAKHCYPLPDGISYQDAAAVLVNYTVAHSLLFDVANIRKGQTVLILSIGGGVGQALAQLCKTVKDVTVIGIASKAKHEQLNDVCHHLLERESYTVTQVKKVAEHGVDVVLDCSCGEDVSRGYSLLKPMGRYVLYGTSFFVSGETKNLFSFAKSWWQVDRINPIKLYDDNKSISGFNMRHLLFQQGQHAYIAEKVATVFDLFKSSKISPVVDSTWAFEDIAEAMQKMHDRKNVGKLLLDPAKEPKPRPVEPEKPVKVGRKESRKDKRNKEKKESEEKSKKEADEKKAAATDKKSDDAKEANDKDASKEEAKKENGDAEEKEKSKD
ncbi:synaptic vesicle membrane protein VAT-1 homolog-like [Galendromus occidentalis]|uniref:Synaptic vesicle membrane protein VAT-1 homolog-like n=1 Tax=Galendromus occidentalis TaxID=34638 RepID=A0AAJ6VUW6_9ACAR|nr:synaptic vesicle membrane protein VAT-1 homolog-like [Galendromus occidentalis]